MDAMAAIKQTFFQECEEQLLELESGLLALDDGTSDAETIHAVFRAVHSIKGGAGAFGLDQLVRFAHTFETCLDLVRSGRTPISSPLLKTLLGSADMLADLVRHAREGAVADEADVARAARCLEEASGSADAPEEAAQADEPVDFTPIQVSLDDLVAAAPMRATYDISFTPKPGFYARANEPLVMLRELARLGELTTSCEAIDLPLLSEIDPEGAYLTWRVTLVTDADESAIREVFEFVEFDCDLVIEQQNDGADFDSDAFRQLMALAQGVEPEDVPPPTAVAETPAPTPAAAAADSAEREESGTKRFGPAGATIRVDLDRLERLINLVGELVINQAMLSQRVAEAKIARSSAIAMGLDDLEQLSREIQDSVMAIRAQPVKPVFQRMFRVAREAADMTGKSVTLQCEGDTTEVDKTVIESLTDPLTHMIRNAVDHGIEKPEARLAAGKPETGRIRLSASHRSGRIVIEISDDGGGINRERVKASAISKGLIDPEAALTDEEIDNLIFLPGFSTAATVTDMSGRGVGMDVVKRSIQSLGGRISIQSRPGQGSTFVLSLPLTLAVLDGMAVTVADETLVVPLTAIVETLKPSPTDVFDLGGEARVIRIRESFVPLIDVGRALGYRREPADASRCVAILVDLEGRARRALLVDDILGQRQVVIKSLEANYRSVPGIAAATILGDGRVALILDVDAVAETVDKPEIVHADAPSTAPALSE